MNRQGNLKEKIINESIQLAEKSNTSLSEILDKYEEWDTAAKNNNLDLKEVLNSNNFDNPVIVNKALILSEVAEKILEKANNETDPKKVMEVDIFNIIDNSALSLQDKIELKKEFENTTIKDYSPTSIFNTILKNIAKIAGVIGVVLLLAYTGIQETSYLKENNVITSEINKIFNKEEILQNMSVSFQNEPEKRIEMIKENSSVFKSEKFLTSSYYDKIFIQPIFSKSELKERLEVINTIMSEKNIITDIQSPKEFNKTPLVNTLVAISRSSIDNKDKQSLYSSVLQGVGISKLKNTLDHDGNSFLYTLFEMKSELPGVYKELGNDIKEIMKNDFKISLSEKDQIKLLLTCGSKCEEYKEFISNLSSEKLNETYNVNGEKTTLLEYAIENADSSIVKELIQNGAKIENDVFEKAIVKSEENLNKSSLFLETISEKQEHSLKQDALEEIKNIYEEVAKNESEIKENKLEKFLCEVF